MSIVIFMSIVFVNISVAEKRIHLNKKKSKHVQCKLFYLSAQTDILGFKRYIRLLF